MVADVSAQAIERFIRLNRIAHPVQTSVPALQPDEIAVEREVLTRLATYATEEGLDFHAVVAMWHFCLLALQSEGDPELVAYIGEQIGRSGADATAATARKFIGWVMAREMIGDSQVDA